MAAWYCLLLIRWKADGSPSPAPMLKGGRRSPSFPAARKAGAASAKYRSLMATEWVHRFPKRARRKETSRGVRLLASGIGMFGYASSHTPGRAPGRFLISPDLRWAKGIEASVRGRRRRCRGSAR